MGGIGRICRLCLMEYDEDLMIIEGNNADQVEFPEMLILNEDQEMLNIIYRTTSLKLVESSHQIIQFLCEKCEKMLRSFATFRDRCIVNDDIFRRKFLVDYEALSGGNDIERIYPAYGEQPTQSAPDDAKTASEPNIEWETKTEPEAVANEILGDIENDICYNADDDLIPEYDRELFEAEEPKQFSTGTEQDIDPGELVHKVYDCDICFKRFYRKDHMTIHRRTHTGEKPYSCHFCPKAFSQSTSLTLHIRTHTGERPYGCHICSKRFNQRSSLNSHYRVHDGHRIQKCHECGLPFPTSKELAAHVLMHKQENPHKCMFCAKSYTNNEALNAHMQTHFEENAPLPIEFVATPAQQGDQEFKCKYCQRTFNRRNALTVHERSHTGERPYQCRHCSRMFSRLTSLNLHIQTHTQEKPFKCSFCGKGFNRKDNLQLHYRTHTRELPYQCNICHRRFNHQGTLKLHLRVHTGERPFQCNVCDRKFTAVGNYNVHMRTHKLLDDPGEARLTAPAALARKRQVPGNE